MKSLNKLGVERMINYSMQKSLVDIKDLSEQGYKFFSDIDMYIIFADRQFCL